MAQHTWTGLKSLDQLFTRLQRTKAVLSWAHTTVVPEGEAGRELGDDTTYNTDTTSSHPPTSGGSKFLALDGFPSDFYLRLAGQAGKLLRNEIPISESVPVKR